MLHDISYVSKHFATSSVAQMSIYLSIDSYSIVNGSTEICECLRLKYSTLNAATVVVTATAAVAAAVTPTVNRNLREKNNNNNGMCPAAKCSVRV